MGASLTRLQTWGPITHSRTISRHGGTIPLGADGLRELVLSTRAVPFFPSGILGGFRPALGAERKLNVKPQGLGNVVLSIARVLSEGP